MSQHHFSAKYQNRDVDVVLGYDRPLGCFFMTVRYEEPAPAEDDTIPADEDDPIVYSNLDDPAAGFHRDLDYYRAMLRSLEITVPESMFRETRQDAIKGAGNRIIQHYGDGQIETILDEDAP